MKSKCCNKPLRLSRENPEPGETMYYICDGCNQPADPKDDYVDKNYPDEREVSKLKEASMQSKPQLSAEIEKLFDEEFTVAEIWGMPLPNYNGRKIIYEDEALNAIKEHNKKVKHFLATVLEEQRTEMMKKVVELNKKWGAVPNDFRHWHQELVESLNGKDTNE